MIYGEGCAEDGTLLWGEVETLRVLEKIVARGMYGGMRQANDNRSSKQGSQYVIPWQITNDRDTCLVLDTKKYIAEGLDLEMKSFGGGRLGAESYRPHCGYEDQPDAA